MDSLKDLEDELALNCPVTRVLTRHSKETDMHPRTGVLTKDAQRRDGHAWRKPHEDGGRDGEDAARSLGPPGAVAAGGGRRHPPWEPPEGGWPWGAPVADPVR